MELIIITGLSGAGKSAAMRYMEDIGFYCIDNIPPKLIAKFADLCRQSKINKVAVVVDIRLLSFFDDLFESLYELKDSAITYKILFLDASDNVLIKRYKETRRTHPLSKERSIEEGIKLERKTLQPMREKATYIIDTSNLKPRQLKDALVDIFVENKNYEGLIISVVSFGFKHGILLDADLVFDVRFLPNPYYIETLKEFTGEHEDIKNYVFMFPETTQFLGKIYSMLDFLIPYYIKEGKTRLVIGIGCTGGKHRSVVLANAIYDTLKNKGHRVTVNHRDMMTASKR